MNPLRRLIARLRPTPRRGWQDFEVGTYATEGHYASPAAPEPTEANGWTCVGYTEVDPTDPFHHHPVHSDEAWSLPDAIRADAANRACLVRGLPLEAGFGAQVVIPAADTFGTWLPIPGTRYEYKRDGMSAQVRHAGTFDPHPLDRAFPDLTHEQEALIRGVRENLLQQHAPLDRVKIRIHSDGQEPEDGLQVYGIPVRLDPRVPRGEVWVTTEGTMPDPRLYYDTPPMTRDDFARDYLDGWRP